MYKLQYIYILKYINISHKTYVYHIKCPLFIRQPIKYTRATDEYIMYMCSQYMSTGGSGK